MDEESNIDFAAKLCFLNGIPFSKPEKYKNISTFYKILWYFYVIVPFIMTAIFFTTAFIQLFYSYSDQKVIISFGLFLVYFSSFSWKLFFIILKRDEYDRIYHRIRSLATEFSLRKDGYEQIHKFYYEPMKKLGTVSLNFIITLSSGYMLGVCVWGFFVDKKTRYLPIIISMPYDAYENPAYALTIALEGIGGCFLVIRNTAVDFIPVTILTITTAQLKYLHTMLVKMFNEEKQDKQFEKDFDWWLRSHQNVLEVLKDFKQLCSYYLVTTYVGAMVDLFLAGMAITTPNLDWDIFKSVTIIGNILVPVIQLYVLCVVADTLTDAGLTTVTESMSPKLIFSEKSTKSSILFATLRSTRPIKFTTAGLYPLSVETFRDMIRLTVTYFVTVVQIRARFSSNHE